ncbi:MAG TPA: hypothetical protein VF265_08340 [Nevskiaceae bacterium]
MSVRARAPGKLVLMGEYAVLEGAPAVVMAVDRHVAVEVGAAKGRRCELYAPDVHDAVLTFAVDAGGGVKWDDAAHAMDFALVVAVIGALAQSGLLPSAPWRADLDSATFFDHRDGRAIKLGLGSSAALTAALASALVANAGRADILAERGAWLERLLAIHRRFQRGRGSGLDVAAAVYGGEIVFRNRGTTVDVERCAWPAAVERIYVWSGRSASTRAFLEQLTQWRDGEPGAYRRCMDRIGAASEAGVAALRGGAADALLRAVERTTDALRALDRASKIRIFSAEHDAIADAVTAAGGVYKPCGAGGGDLGLALASGEASVRRVTDAVRAAGYRTVELRTDGSGLTVAPLADGMEAEVETP